MTRDELQVGMIIKDEFDNFYEIMHIPEGYSGFFFYAFNSHSNDRGRIEARSVFWSDRSQSYVYKFLKSQSYTLSDKELESCVYVAY